MPSDLAVRILDQSGDWVDVADRGVSASVRRGRQDETESYGFGSAQIVLRNLDGYFDPDGTFPLRLRQQVELRSALFAYGTGTWAEASGTWDEQTQTWLGALIFSGFVEDVDLRYEPGGNADLTLSCVDGLSILSNQSVTGLVVPLEDSGARVRRILTSPGVAFPGPTSVDDGEYLLGAATVTANVTEYLRKAELSEQGRLFVDREGTLVYLNRRSKPGTPYVFADDGTGTYFSTIERFSGARALFNRVTGQREGGPTITANSLTSQSEYSVRTRDLGSLLLSSDTVVIGLVSYLAVLYSDPPTRAYAVSVVVDRLDQASQYELLELDLSDSANVIFTPPGAAQFTSPSLIQGIEHRITVGSAWTTTFYFEPRSDEQFFTLDDDTLGLLDLNKLTY